MFNISNPAIEMPDEKLAIAIFRSVRWVHGVYCPQCKSYNVNNRGSQGRVRRYTCKDCGSNFNDFTGTFFIKSKIPLGVMLYILLNMENKSIKELTEDTGYSRQCISRITKLFRDKLFNNPEFYEMGEFEGEL